MARRLVLLGFMSIIEPGTVLQLTIAMCFSLIYTVLTIQAAPYRSPSDQYMALCTNTAITMSLMHEAAPQTQCPAPGAPPVHH